MVSTPPATPETVPEPPPTVAIEASLVVHVPPAVVLLSVVTLPWHTVAVPVMGEGMFTLTVVVAVQPPPKVV